LIQDVDDREDEVYESLLAQGRCLKELGRDPRQKLLEAAARSPLRAEPYYEIALWHGEQALRCSNGPLKALCEAEHHLLCFLYAREVGNTGETNDGVATYALSFQCTVKPGLSL
jgi:hypothetical protein